MKEWNDNPNPENSINNVSEILTGNKNLAIFYVLDDREEKLDSITNNLHKELETLISNSNQNFLIFSHQIGQSTIDQYCTINNQIKEQNLNGNKKIIQFLLLDGELSENDNHFGASVAYSIVRIALENQYEIPYFFGFSGTNELNEDVRIHINFALENQEPNGNKWYTSLPTEKKRQNIDDLIQERDTVEKRNNSYYLGNTHNKDPSHIMPTIRQILSL